jgi:chromosome segregation ATPase
MMVFGSVELSVEVIIVIFIVLSSFIFIWLSNRKAKVLASKLEDIKEKLNESENQFKEIQQEIISEKVKSADLNNKYGSIIDMELHTQQLLEEAEKKIKTQRFEAERLRAKAEHEANQMSVNSSARAEKLIEDTKREVENLKVETINLNSNAHQKLKDIKEKVVTLTDEAHVEAGRILELAKIHAQEIAGDAYDAKLKADSYESAIKAMKNTIEGYKDDYIIPNHSVLDDLAEEFSFKDAGEKLKYARKRVKDMVKQGHAGDCDYVETHRKTYAIHFAVDAFNGKVDSALTKVKHDNFGKIKQEIIDAFALVNHNGAPFRNARINQAFLDARQDELKWAVSTHELRQMELAEQREIKQQIREEEKARKEIEKAIKDAEKEERLIQKALEKARSELSNANEEQRIEFEAQLANLESKLKEAEEKGQRALSMAQQTRRGHVYVISNIGSFGENIFKIGMTRRLEPLDRVKELGDASVPFSFDVHAMLYSDDAPALEKALHRRFDRESVNKVNYRKEFFRTSLAEIKQTVIQQGVTEVHWTMKAEAAEFRESIAIEKQQQEEIVA